MRAVVCYHPTLNPYPRLNAALLIVGVIAALRLFGG
jgi:hypothetical protein